MRKSGETGAIWLLHGLDHAMSLFAKGIQLVDSARLDVAICAKPHITFGIYRPGGASETSQIAFDDLVVTAQ